MNHQERLLRLHEGTRRKPYRDTVGKLTVGVGRNLDDKGLRDDEIALMLTNDIKECEADLDRALPWWRTLNAPRQHVLLDMCFNLGLTKLLGFKNTLKYIQQGNWAQAKANMLQSLWARQVGSRAVRLGQMMEQGEWPVDV